MNEEHISVENKTIKNLLAIMGILITMCGCNMKNVFSQPEESLLAKLVIFPTGIEYETYIIELKSNGIISTTFGLAEGLVIKNPKRSEKQKLEISIDVLKKMIQNLPNEKKEKDLKIYKGGWEFVLFIPQTKNKYRGNFSEMEGLDEQIAGLIKYLIKLSPIKINMHGWS